MYKKASIFVVFIIILLVSISACQVERQTYTELDQLMAQTFAADGPGVTVFVENPDVGEHILAIGLADLESGKEIKSKNHLRIGDITKTFVSTLVFQLVEEGNIGLDDTLAQHFAPEIVAGIPYSDQITIRQLLNMSSGIYDYRQNPEFIAAVTADPIAKWSAADVLTFVYGQEPIQEPGVGFAYSNTNYILLHILIEQEMDDILAEDLRDRILDKLTLDDTYLEIAEDIAVGYISGYADLDGDGDYDSTLNVGDARGLGDMGLVSNVLNLADFVPALYERSFTGENGRELSLATIPMGNGDEYGLGIMRRDTPWGPMWGHDDAQPGFAGQMWYLPDHETTIVVLSNGVEKDKLAAFVLDALAVVIQEP
ncbi:MAG: beta-lactamase family protein [Anaerolineales bacterium]|nr:beta-lactamase family protein [Anaerolineales bacterium]